MMILVFLFTFTNKLYYYYYMSIKSFIEEPILSALNVHIRQNTKISVPVPMMREDEMANLHEANRCIHRLVSLLLIQRSILINVVPAVQNLNDEGKRGGG